MKWTKFFLNFTGILLLIYTSFRLLINPSLFEDEGYYLGATQSILSGDFLMAHYAFDKPFLLGFWPIPGIFALGPSPIGYHLTALVCFLFAFVSYQKILELFSKNIFKNFLFALMTFALPLIQEHGVSLFCEPYMLLFTTLLILAILKSESSKKIANLFLVSFFTKYSMALWAPLVFGFALQKNRDLIRPRAFFQWIVQFIKNGKLLFILWFVFSISNAAKFGSVAWLSLLVHDNAQKAALAERLKTWVEILYHALPHPAFSLLGIFIFFSGGWFVFQRSKNSSVKNLDTLQIIWFAVLIHFLAFAFSGARFYDRYLVLFIPVYFLSIFIILQKWVNAFPRLSQIAEVSVTLVFFVGVIYELNLPKYSLSGKPELGRKLYVVRDELNRREAILQTNVTWKSAAFRQDLRTTGCSSLECTQDLRKGNSANSFHYALMADEPGVLPEIWRAPLLLDLSKLKRKTFVVPYSQNELVGQVLQSLKLKKAIQVSDVKIEPQDQSLLRPHDLGQTWQPFLSGPTITISGSTDRLEFLLGKHPKVELRGRVGVNELKELGGQMNQPRPTLVYEVEQLLVNGDEMTDVLPLFFNGYTFKIGVLPVEWMEKTAFEGLVYDQRKEQWLVTTTSVATQ